MKQTDNKKGWDAKSRGGAFGHLFFIWVIKHVGVQTAYFFQAFIVIYFIPFAPKATKAIWSYNRSILRYPVVESLMKIWLHYFRFGQTLIDKIAITSGMDHKYTFEFDDYDSFLEVLDRGDGVVMIGAHVGAWEIGSCFFGDYGHKINVVMFDAEYRKVSEAIEKSGRKQPYKIIPVNKDSIDSVFEIKRILDQGEYVCFQGDRFLNENKNITSQFLGKEAVFPSGPFLLASRLRKPVVFYYSTREKGMKYRFHFTVVEPIAGRDAQQVIFNKYIRSLEQIVKAYPQQWFNFYNYWK